MYHVVGTIFIASVLYLISYFFHRLGYFSYTEHKKIWNTILAISFFITAFAGLFMALQVSYKWEISFIKAILKWHVEFGIGMAVTGLFHVILHFSYFRKFFNKPETVPEQDYSNYLPSSGIGINLFYIGFVSSSIQFLLIREIMNISGGYELITGTFLGSWLIASAIGASLAIRSTLVDIRRINLIFSLSPFVSLTLLLSLSRLFLATGETPSFLLSLIYTFIVLIPFCLVSGFTFVKLISIARASNGYVPGKSFSIETTGGIAAGVLVPVLTSRFLNTYQLILLILTISIVYVILTFLIDNPRSKFLIRLFAAIIASIIIIFNPDILFRQFLLPGIKVSDTQDTPYGNITTGNYKGEKSLYYNQRLLFFRDDAIQREEDIHYAMLQRRSPEKVIIISGSLNSYLPEVSKYPVQKLIYIERDPSLAALELIQDTTKYKSLTTIVNNDAFTYIKRSDELVDVIISLIPPPSTLLLNRYYTTDFFAEVKKNLVKGGIFMCSPGPGDNYFNKESVYLYSSVYNSMASVFKNIKPVVGNKLYFLASDDELSVSFCGLTEERNIRNVYVCSDYLSDELTAIKSQEVESLIDHDIRQNRYIYPVASLYFQEFNFSKNFNEKTAALVLMILLFALPVIAIRRENMLMYSSASALAGFEIIILLTLQIVIGNMYLLTGLVVAGIMTGLAAGAGKDVGFLKNVHLRFIGITLLLYYVITGFFYNNLLAIGNGLLSVLLIIFSAILPAFITGNLFRELTCKNQNLSGAGPVYAADLAGSAFGFILIGGFAVPAFGIQISIFILSALILISVAFGTIRNKL